MVSKRCCGLCSMKTTMNIFQVIFLITGIAICIMGTLHFLSSYHLMNILDSSVYTSITYLYLSTGCLVILVFLIGCCAIPKNRTKLLFCYILLLVIIFLTEELVGILSYIYYINLEEDVNLNYNQTILNSYNYDISKTTSIDYVQQEFKCCGADTFVDWKYSSWLQDERIKHKVPDSCCKSVLADCGRRDHPSNIYYEGCLILIITHIKHNLWIICVVALGFSVVQVVGIILAVIIFLAMEAEKLSANYSASAHETLVPDEAFG